MRGKETKENIIITFVAIIVAVIVAVAISWVYVLFNIEDYDYELTKLNEEQLYPMNNTSGDEVLVWTSQIFSDIGESEMVYNYSVKDEKTEGYEQKQIPVSKVKIFYLEDEDAEPTLVEMKRDYGFFKNTASPIGYREEYHLHVPKGSVVNKIEMNN